MIEALTLFIPSDDPHDLLDAAASGSALDSETPVGEEVLRARMITEDGQIRVSALRRAPEGQAGHIMRGSRNFARSQFPDDFTWIGAHLDQTKVIVGLVFVPPALEIDDARVGLIRSACSRVDGMMFDGQQFFVS